MTSVVCVKKALLNKAGYRDFEDWVCRPSNEYIGRNMNFYVKGATGSKWANPFAVKRYGLAKCLDLYRAWVTTGVNPISNKKRGRPLIDEIDELRGRQLGCWCAPADPCHGKLLVELLQEQDRTRTVSDHADAVVISTMGEDLYMESVESDDPSSERCDDILLALEEHCTIKNDNGNDTNKITIAMLHKTNIGKTMSKCLKALKRHHKDAIHSNDASACEWQGTVSKCDCLLSLWKDMAKMEAEETARKKRVALAAKSEKGSEKLPEK